MSVTIAGQVGRELDFAPIERTVLRELLDGRMSHIVAASSARGGSQLRGGVTWLDWEEEFAPVYGFDQIVGHSRGASVRYVNRNYCLDTDLEHFAIVNGSEIEIRHFMQERL